MLGTFVAAPLAACGMGSRPPAWEDGIPVTVTWNADALALCRREKTVEPARDGGVTLRDRELIQDEIGDTIHSASPDAAEWVGGSVRVSKDFDIGPATAAAAELCIFTDGRVTVAFNGAELPPYERIPLRSRPYSGVYPADKFAPDHPMHDQNGKPFKEFWQGGWERVPIAGTRLRPGLNSVVLSAEDGATRRFLIAPSHAPDRSAVSRDGGKTWDRNRLSRLGNIDGEYPVRLALTRHPESGWIESEPVDLWPKPAGPIALAATVASVSVETEADLPRGSRLKLQVRMGATPGYEAEHWSAWCDPSEAARGHIEGRPLTETQYRFAQWRAIMVATPDRRGAPRLSAVRLRASIRPTPPAAGMFFSRTEVSNPPIVRPSTPFVHARNTARARLLREAAGLDAVVADKPRGLPQVMELAALTRREFGKNSSGSSKQYPGWNALLLWHTSRGKEAVTSQMCTHRAAFFVQCAAALGYPARIVIWSHSIAEVWLDTLGKWVAVDPSSAVYFEIDGQPASLLEVAMLASGRPDGEPSAIVMERRIGGKGFGPRKMADLAWFTRFWMVPRSNHLDTPEPAEQGHGTTGFKYDGYVRWLHPQKEPLPWFANTSSRKGDFAFSVNTVNIHLAQGANGLDVHLENDTDPIAAFEIRRNGEPEWTQVPAAFTWTITAGTNTLEARSVNAFGFPGRVASARVVAHDD